MPIRRRFPSETLDRFIVRLPHGMRDRLAKSADANNRSMNAELVSRLEESFAGDARSKAAAAKLLRTAPSGTSLEGRVAELEKRVAKLEEGK